MPFRICNRGHITGVRKCVSCGSDWGEVFGLRTTVPPKLDKKQKRLLDRAIRERGGMPIQSLRHQWMNGVAA